MDASRLPESSLTLEQATAQFLKLLLEAACAPDGSLDGWSLADRSPATIEQLLPFFSWVYRYYFRVKTDGWEQIPTRGKLLLVGSHNGGLAAPDTVMLTYDWMRRFGSQRLAYALMEPKMWQVFPAVARLATQVGCVRADSRMAITALRREAAVLIYPGGVRDVFRPHALRHQVCFFNQTGFIKLALLEAAPIIPVISHGAYDTLLVLTDLYPHLQKLHRSGLPWPFGIDPGVCPVYLGLPWGVAVGPWPNLPLPVQIHIRVCPPITFDRHGPEAARDRFYVGQCYEHVLRTMQQALDSLVVELEDR